METLLEFVVKHKLTNTIHGNIDDIEKNPYIYNKVTIYTHSNDIDEWLKLSKETKTNIILITQKALDIINKDDVILSDLYFYGGNNPTFTVKQNKNDKYPKGWLIYHEGKSNKYIQKDYIGFSGWTNTNNDECIVVNASGKIYTPNIADIINKN